MQKQQELLELEYTIRKEVAKEFREQLTEIEEQHEYACIASVLIS